MRTTTAKMQMATGILEVIWSLPLIGFVILLTPIFPAGMIVLHLLTIILALKEKGRMVGNLLGLTASLLAFSAALDFNVYDYSTSANDAWVVQVIISWPLHILGIIFIFSNRSKNVRDWKEAQILQETQEKEEAAELERKRNEDAMLAREKERFNRAGTALMNIYRKGSKIAVDTNILIDQFSSKLIYSLLENHQVSLCISIVVLKELDGLKNDNGKVGAAAREAIRVLEYYQTSDQIRLTKSPSKEFLDDHGLGSSNDDQIVGGYLKEQIEQNRNFIFMTNDRMPRIIASAAGLEVFDYYRF